MHKPAEQTTTGRPSCTPPSCRPSCAPSARGAQQEVTAAALPPAIKQEVCPAMEHLANMMSTSRDAQAHSGPQDLAPPPPKRPRVAVAAPQIVAQRKAAGQPTSRYVGVTWAKHLGKWKAQITDGEKHVVQSLGCFEQEVAAAKAFDVVARKLRGNKAHGWRNSTGQVWKLNFPTKDEADHAEADYVGVCHIKKAGKWRVQIRHKGETLSLGVYGDRISAAKAYDEAARKLRGDEAHGRSCANGVVWRLNFPTEVEQAKYAAAQEAAVCTDDQQPECCSPKTSL